MCTCLPAAAQRVVRGHAFLHARQGPQETESLSRPAAEMRAKGGRQQAHSFAMPQLLAMAHFIPPHFKSQIPSSKGERMM